MAQVFDFEALRARKQKEKPQGFTEADIDRLLACLEGPQIALTDQETRRVTWQHSPEYVRQLIRSQQFISLHEAGNTQGAIDGLVSSLMGEDRMEEQLARTADEEPDSR